MTATIASLVDRRLPPIAELGAASLAAVAAGVVYTASYLPEHAPLAAAVALLCIAAALQLANWLLLARIRDFAWGRFFQVARWSLLAYIVIGGMIEYAFLYDHTRGTYLALLSALLALFVLDVPVLIAFTVARYEHA